MVQILYSAGGLVGPSITKQVAARSLDLPLGDTIGPVGFGICKFAALFSADTFLPTYCSLCVLASISGSF